MKNKFKILAVDDNSGIRTALNLLLNKHFGEVRLLSSPKTLQSEIRDFCPDTVLLDMNFEKEINTGNEGLFWLSEIKRFAPEVEVVLFTAYADIALAVEGMKRGAFDFVVKPWENEKLIEILESACRKKKGESARNGAGDQKTQNNRMYWGSGAAMTAIRHTVEKIAATDASVLITGENGTGKDVLASEIHRLSGRSSRPMVCVDAGAITETLFESELFGHVKGAFTDAHADHIGKIEQADGSTLFLDEIGNIPMHLQAKLLRVLQNRTVCRLGSTESRPVDIRLICATNRNIAEMVRNGEFREDLFYRINTMQIELPPLRNRKDEIIPLTEMFIERFAEKYHREIKGLSPSAEEALTTCRWNGNIRELQNAVEKAVILSEGKQLEAGDFNISVSEQIPASDIPEEETLEMAEERTIRAAMERYEGNLTHVAKSLNISRPTLYAKLKKYNM